MPAGMPFKTRLPPDRIVVTPSTTYVIVELILPFGASIPMDVTGADILPSYPGQSIGKWIDIDSDGKYDVLEVETRRPSRARACTTPTACRCTSTRSIFKERSMWRPVRHPPR